MTNLFDKIKQGDKVQGKTTGQIYEVWVIDPTAKEGEDAIVLVKQLGYTRAQFNAHFKKVKTNE